jgi:hypothetical protein
MKPIGISIEFRPNTSIVSHRPVISIDRVIFDIIVNLQEPLREIHHPSFNSFNVIEL